MLINDSGINTATALEIYNIANIMANKRSEAYAIANKMAGKKPKVNIVGAAEIQAKLVLLLQPIILKFGIENLEKYYAQFFDWDVSKLSQKRQSECAAFQTVIMGQLYQYKENIDLYKNDVAQYQKSIDERLKRKNEEVSIKYKNYLSNKITITVKNITDEKTLKNLYKTVTNDSSDEIKSISAMQDIVSKKLKESSKENGLIDKLKAQNLLSVGTLQLITKHDIMTNAVGILQGEYTSNQINDFYNHLIKHKNDLTVSRKESGFKTFLKGLGVVGATIFGLGIGGYFAYQGLFRHSNGKEYIQDINRTYNKIVPAA